MNHEEAGIHKLLSALKRLIETQKKKTKTKTKKKKKKKKKMTFWSAENATKAFLNTVKMDQRSKEPNVAEFISALAAGNNSQHIVVACGGVANAAILLALKAAAHQTDGRVVCILRGVEELIMSEKILRQDHQIQFTTVGEDDGDMFSKHFEEADFVVIDCKLENHEGIVQKIVDHRQEEEEERRSSKGAVIVGYNALLSKVSWRFSNGRMRSTVQFLPIGEGLLLTRININKTSSGDEELLGGRNLIRRRKSSHHWVVKVDKCTGEEHVFRVRVPRGKVA